MNKYYIYFVFLLLNTALLFAHGTDYEVYTDGIVGIQAMYDNGMVMENSSVLIFAPNEAEVFLERVTDINGFVCFKPDRAGTWVLQVRGDGVHGMRINLNVDENMLVLDGGNNASEYIQKIIMAVCVVFGLISTALFFKSKKEK